MGRLDRAVETAVGLILVVLVVTAFGQVVARYLFVRPFAWVLELDMLLLVWATFLAAYVGVRRDLHLRVDYVLDRLSPRARRCTLLLGRALAMVFVAVLGITSLDVVRAMDGIPFTALPFGQQALYWSVPAGSALMLLALVERAVRDWRGLP